MLPTLWSIAAAAAAAGSSSLPVGRWSGELVGLPSGKLGTNDSHAPLLGNGYLGVTMSSLRSPVPLHRNGSSLDLWINSNANWDCQRSGKALPPAVCSTRMLGVLSVAAYSPDLTGDRSRLATEQRIEDGVLWMQRTSIDSSVMLTAEMQVHPEKNVLIVKVTASASDGALLPNLEATLSTYGPNRHIASAVAACNLDAPRQSAPRWSAACSRRYHKLTDNTTAFTAPWTALAMTSAHSLSGSSLSSVFRGNVSRGGYVSEYVTAAFVADGARARTMSVELVVALADNVMGSNNDDPAASATSLALATSPAEVDQSSKAFWRAYWAASSVTLPTRKALETMWYGAQYATATAFPSARTVRLTKGRAPPPGLYGPYTTADFAFWNGDYTLDYNQEATYFHVYSSNHPERAAGYFGPLIDWMGAARAQAAEAAAKANLSSCSAKALHYAAHLAPWGQQSRDTSVYGHYEGSFAAKIFIDDWEYTRNAKFALEVTLPFLEGLNAWFHCFLHQSTTANGTTTLEDWNAISPDQIFENTPARNPIGALSLMRRTATAHREIALSLGVGHPAYVDAIISRLAALPTATGPEPGTRVWATGDGVSWQKSAYYYAMPLFPVYPGEVHGGPSTDEATQRIAEASLRLYSNLTCAPHFIKPPWSSCVGDGFGTVVFFAAAARILAGRATFPQLASATPGQQTVTAALVANAFERHIGTYGANASNLLAFVPGGGVESAGLAHSVNVMLVQSDGLHVQLFPAWPVEEDASFDKLRVKGAFVVSARWDAVRRAPSDVHILSDGDSAWCGLVVGAGGAGGGGTKKVTVRCTAGGDRGSAVIGSRVEHSLCTGKDGRVRWRVTRGAVCDVIFEDASESEACV